MPGARSRVSVFDSLGLSELGECGDRGFPAGGAAGVERILAPDLTAEEQAGLVASADTLKKAMVAMDAAG